MGRACTYLMNNKYEEARGKCGLVVVDIMLADHQGYLLNVV